MSVYDEELRALREQMERKRQLDAMLKDLRGQQQELTARVSELEKVKLEEQADVDRLEGHSLAAFFYGVIGKMDEKLTQERQEAYAARVKYDAAVRELSAVEEDLERKETEYRRLEGCEQRYAQVLRKKQEELKNAGGETAGAILELEERLADLRSQRKELDEASSAGRGALVTADQILHSLDSAHGWATWDLLGGGLVADLAKHSHLDSAQAAVERLQVELRRFKTELADVTIDADLQVSIDGFLRFADYFFDGLFVDWGVMDRINQSQAAVEETRGRITAVLDRLNAMSDGAERESAETRERLDALVRDSGVDG
ncbi:hypothetical protein [uncultured Intestinimonas sp.]|uniref:hypothetical protein n=1 Tax=uncultured Intestinimonas sp. TaxID=1689265 RepID=UPI0025DC3848|nr:hypothetical protein [uncultured Intestinimonas sp.]